MLVEIVPYVLLWLLKMSTKNVSAISVMTKKLVKNSSSTKVKQNIKPKIYRKDFSYMANK